MGGQPQDDHTSAYIWREMSLYKHRDYDFDNLKARLFTGGAEVIAAWAAIAGETNYKLTDKKDPAALYPQAVYMSSAGYSGNGQPVGPYTYTFAFSTRGNPGRPDRYCGVDESLARSQSATPITGIRYLGLATYNSVRVKCQPHVIEAMRNGTSLTSDAGLEPDTTSNVPAMYNSKPASLYIVQKDRLHCTNVDSTATNWELKGETSWAGTTSMAQLGSSLYIIQANRLHRVQQTNGAWTQISPSSWDGPTFMAALGNYLYVIQNNRLHRVDPSTGAYELLGSTSWAGTTSMTVLGDSLYIIQANSLHRVSPVDGSWTVISGDVWTGPTQMASIDGSLYIIQNSRLHRADPATGAWQVLGSTSWAGATSMSAVQGLLYIIQADRLHRADPATGRFEILGSSSWDGPTSMASYAGLCP